MKLLVKVFADKDFEHSVDSYTLTLPTEHFNIVGLVADAKKRFGDTYSGLDITIREES